MGLTKWPRSAAVKRSALLRCLCPMQRASTAELPAMPPSLGPEVDTSPRPLPARVSIAGRYAMLEPLHRRHAAELWQAAQGADDSWAYLPFGPFASADAMAGFVAEFASTLDRMVWAVRPVSTGLASGWLSL